MDTQHSDHPTNDDSIDLTELWGRLRRGLISTLGLSFLGLAVGVIIAFIFVLAQPSASSMRVAFSFSGFERGTYPNGSNFTADDLRAPDIIAEALKRLGLPTDKDLASKIRGALSISGVVPDAIVKERNRLLDAGQIPPAFIPDEYTLSLALPREFSLGKGQRERLLNEIISLYREKFRRTYVELPLEFNDPFVSLQDADYPEYELVLNQQMDSLISFLRDEETKAGDFRSSTNNLSFHSLMVQTQLFSRVRVNDILSVIYSDGLTKNRKIALTKMSYYLRTLDDQEQRLRDQESVVTDLLKQSRDHAQGYVLASKTQFNADKPVVDQGLINSLLANDSYNMLVRKALDAGSALKNVEADKARLMERKSRMEEFAKAEQNDQSVAITAVQQALAGVESDYAKLLSNVRIVLRDYSAQKFAHAIRTIQPPHTSSLWRGLAIAGIVGLVVGTALGLGLSLLDLAPRRKTVS